MIALRAATCLYNDVLSNIGLPNGIRSHLYNQLVSMQLSFSLACFYVWLRAEQILRLCFWMWYWVFFLVFISSFKNNCKIIQKSIATLIMAPALKHTIVFRTWISFVPIICARVHMIGIGQVLFVVKSPFKQIFLWTPSYLVFIC
jgi:hypothetical protein